MHTVETIAKKINLLKFGDICNHQKEDPLHQIIDYLVSEKISPEELKIIKLDNLYDHIKKSPPHKQKIFIPLYKKLMNKKWFPEEYNFSSQ